MIAAGTKGQFQVRWQHLWIGGDHRELYGERLCAQGAPPGGGRWHGDVCADAGTSDLITGDPSSLPVDSLGTRGSSALFPPVTVLEVRKWLRLPMLRLLLGHHPVWAPFCPPQVCIQWPRTWIILGIELLTPWSWSFFFTSLQTPNPASVLEYSLCFSFSFF